MARAQEKFPLLGGCGWIIHFFIEASIKVLEVFVFQVVVFILMSCEGGDALHKCEVDYRDNSVFWEGSP